MSPSLEEVLKAQSQSMMPVKDSLNAAINNSVPEEASIISGIQARYNHENTIPKTLEPAEPNHMLD